MLANKTGLGRAWIGLILMSAVTSLPELMVGISASAYVQSADLAVGDVLGSCAFNLGILSLMDVFTPKSQPLLGRVSQSHILAAALGIILVALAGVGIFLEHDIVLLPFIGMNSILFAVIYFVALRLIYRYQQQHPVEANTYPEGKVLALRQIIVRYVAFASVIIVAALFLPFFAEKIAVATGLGKTFVGTLFLAASTSLPEIAVSIAAVRMGATDMAVGNLLGSNIFNIFILFIDDLFYTKGHLLKDAAESHLVSAIAVIIMSSIAIIGIVYKSKGKRYFLAWDTFLILIIYIFNMILLYKLSKYTCK
jgi:cation:H+ antiporter